MSRSIQEEILATLWIIAALLAFNGGYSVWGWVFATKGAMDTICSMWCAVKEIIKKKKSVI